MTPIEWLAAADAVVVTTPSVQLGAAAVSGVAQPVNETSARLVAGVRGFYKYLRRAGRLAENPADDLQAPRSLAALPRFLSLEEVDTLLHAPDVSTARGLRDRALPRTQSGAPGPRPRARDRARRPARGRSAGSDRVYKSQCSSLETASPSPPSAAGDPCRVRTVCV